MEQISSGTTFFYKRIFPLFWFGGLAFFLFVFLHDPKQKGGAFVPLFIWLAFMLGLSYFLMKKLVFDLADKVFDAGDSLIVRFGSQQERISLSEIINVNYSVFTNPARVTLTLRTPGRFGREISFAPPQRFFPFSKSPIVDALIDRIDVARRA